MDTAVVTRPTPREHGMAMPAEWAPHELTLMAWPTRLELWGDALGRAKGEYAAVARAIAGFERVLMVAAPGAGAEVRDACGEAVEVLELAIDDSWMRDSGPVIVTAADGCRAGVDFRFNGWGEKFVPYDRDDAMNLALLAHLQIDRVEADSRARRRFDRGRRRRDVDRDRAVPASSVAQS